MISGLYKDSNFGATEIEPHIYQKRLALNIILTFCYGTRFADIDDPLLLGILSDAKTIARLDSLQFDHVYRTDCEIVAFVQLIRITRISFPTFGIWAAQVGLPRRLRSEADVINGLPPCLTR